MYLYAFIIFIPIMQIFIMFGVNETDNPDSICDDCKFSIVSNDDIPPNI
jgi:hypothetical protein